MESKGEDTMKSRFLSLLAVVGILGANFARALGKIWAHVPWPEASGRPEERDPFCPAPNPRGVMAA